MTDADQPLTSDPAAQPANPYVRTPTGAPGTAAATAPPVATDPPADGAEPDSPAVPTQPSAPATPEPAPEPPAVVPAPTPRTRLGGAWVMAVSGAVVLVLLLVFILQNSERVEVHIYGAHWNAPLGVALLMAAALGVLLVVVPGTGRIIQLRRAAHRAHRRATELTRVSDRPLP